jgi:transcriptional regulator with XRE-family HTH domain
MEKELLGKKLKRYRNRKGLSLADTKQHTGIDRSFLSRIENGLDKISPKQLTSLIDLYALSREEAVEVARLAKLNYFVHTSKVPEDHENFEHKEDVSNYIDDIKTSESKNMVENTEKKNQETTAGKIDIHIPGDVKILYSDSAFVTAGNFGIVIDFAQMLGSTSNQQIVARVGMSKEHAEALMGVLQTKIIELQNKSSNKNG